jgi:hypothetical protein
MRVLIALLLSLLCSSAYAGDFTTPGSRAKNAFPTSISIEHMDIVLGDWSSYMELDDDGETLDIGGPENSQTGEDDGTIKMRTGWLRVLGNTITVEGDWAADPDDASYFSARINGCAGEPCVGMPSGTVLGGFDFQATDVAGSGNPIDYVKLDAIATVANDTGELNVKLSTAGVNAYEYIFGGTSFRPYTNDGVALGDADQMWSDLFLASGSVLNWNNGDCALTHSADTLTLTGCTSVGFGAAQTPWTADVDADGFDLLFRDATGILSEEAGNAEIVLFNSVGSAVNELTISNAATGSNPSISATGGDGNIGINIAVKGNAGYSLTTPRLMLNLGAGGGGNVTLYDTSTSPFGPIFSAYHDSASPAANDTVFILNSVAEDSAGNTFDTGSLTFNILDPTDASEDGEIEFATTVAGTALERMRIGDGVIVGSSTTYPGAGNLAFGSGGVINWDASDVLITHSANDLAFTGVTGDYSFDDTVGVTGSVTASVNVTATAGDVTSGDDVIPGDDILMGTVGGIDWGGGIMNLTYQGTDLVSFQGGSFGVHQANDTIASGAVGFSRQYLVIDTEASAATDDLLTMTAPPSNFGGVPRWVQAANDARTVVIKGDSSGNIVGPGGADCILDDAEDAATMIFNSTSLEWVITSCSQVNREHITVAASDETTPITAATGKVKFRMPYAFNVDGVRCSLSTAQNTTGAGTIFTVDINEGDADLDGGNPVSILSTKVTLDDDETTSATATTAPVISDAALASDAEITIDVDAIGDSADAAGLKCSLIGHQ